MSENTTKQDHLYRPCVGIMLLNDRGLVWIGRRTDIDNDEGSGLWWQMPQGGIDENEDPAAAALRDRWAGMDELDSVIVPFKRAVYKDVVAAFRHFAA